MSPNKSSRGTSVGKRRPSFWHSGAPKNNRHAAGLGVHPAPPPPSLHGGHYHPVIQEHWNTSSTALPPIDQLQPSISFEETFIRGNNFGKPMQANIGIQVSAREIQHAHDHGGGDTTYRGGGTGGGGRVNYLKGVVGELKYSIKLKEEEISHLNNSLATQKDRVQQLEDENGVMSVKCEENEERGEEVERQRERIEEMTKEMEQMHSTHTQHVQTITKQCEDAMEAVRSERLSSVEQKEDKVEQLKGQVASLLQQSASVRSEQVVELRDQLVASKQEIRQLQKQVKQFKESCSSCEELRGQLKEREEGVKRGRERERQLREEVDQLHNKLNTQTDLKLSEMERVVGQLHQKDTVINTLKTQLTNSWDNNSQERVDELVRLRGLVERGSRDIERLEGEREGMERQLGDTIAHNKHLKAKLRAMRDEKVKLADLLVGSAEGAEQMQMELEEQIELLTERLQQQKNNGESDRTETSRGGEGKMSSHQSLVGSKASTVAGSQSTGRRRQTAGRGVASVSGSDLSLLSRTIS
ncbi:trichohyalin-like isoform X2 [Symsagittifera roscoffensis]|uniref:trichohyalin-like isoform X2 n=1 Tax=Symsagittifera roscoffensis TaxID=84072 RepID=UPI00307C7ABB